MYNLIFKRVLDLVISMVGICLTSPLWIPIVSIQLVFKNKTSLLFRQARPGKMGEIFYVLKIRTMSDEKDANGHLLPDNLRITPFGRMIRSLSLDELPQLINVLKGDMSLVGPRPLLIEYIPLYSPNQARRHEVKPGITGWAQVNGRNAISWKKKFEYDVWYVDHISFWLDMKILYLTVRKVFVRDGINASENVTMEPFNGNN